MIYEAKIKYTTEFIDQFVANDIDDARDKLEEYVKHDIEETLESGQLNNTTRALLMNIGWVERTATPIREEIDQ